MLSRKVGRPWSVSAGALTIVSIAAAVLFGACEGEEGWRCCQTTAFTCVCSLDGECSGDALVEKCSVDTVPGDDNTCCAHGSLGTCSCSGSDGGVPGEDPCGHEGDTVIDDCSVEP